jgi:hypothetical protein
MPRYAVRRAFPAGVRIPVSDGGAAPCEVVIESERRRRRHLAALVCHRGRRQRVLRLRRADPGGDPHGRCTRRAAGRPITRVGVHDSYSYGHARV